MLSGTRPSLTLPLRYNPSLTMHRSTRTRRLSIAAIVSLLAFVAVAGIGARSFWTWDTFESWGDDGDRAFELVHGCVAYTRTSPDPPRQLLGARDHVHLVGQKSPSLYAVEQAIWGFNLTKQSLVGAKGFSIRLPIWPLLLLLLIGPIRWMISRPAGGPAFPVITEGAADEAGLQRASPKESPRR